ncbi:MAG TPA: hypothetical protein VFH18_06530 [Erysipelotrichaceae bacterium]|nr:hypothetical protein [Erysipelotrichaceae bacterium]
MEIEKNNLNKTTEIIREIEEMTNNLNLDRTDNNLNKTEIIEELAEVEVNNKINKEIKK